MDFKKAAHTISSDLSLVTATSNSLHEIKINTNYKLTTNFKSPLLNLQFFIKYFT